MQYEDIAKLEEILGIVKKIVFCKNGRWLAITEPIQPLIQEMEIYFCGSYNVWAHLNPPEKGNLVIMKELFFSGKGLEASFAEMA